MVNNNTSWGHTFLLQFSSGTKLIVQWRRLIDHSAVALKRLYNSHAQSARSCSPILMAKSLRVWQHLDRGYVNLQHF